MAELGPTADPLAFLPEPVKPNADYPFFVTTVRYQTIWQSGYTFRYLNELASHSQSFMEFVVHPDDANAAGLTDGDWAELSNQFSRCEGVVNVSDATEIALTPSPSMFTFDATNFSVLQTFEVRGVDDPDPDGDQLVTVITQPCTSADPVYNLFDPRNIRVLNRDNE